jgi:hypothetical protein
MRNNRQNGITFQLGTFDFKKYKGHVETTLYKKSQVVSRANLILQRQGYVWLRVNYGRYENNLGKKVMFYNDGTYQSIESVRKALSTFLEQSLIDYLQS